MGPEHTHKKHSVAVVISEQSLSFPLVHHFQACSRFRAGIGTGQLLNKHGIQLHYLVAIVISYDGLELEWKNGLTEIRISQNG